MLKTGWAGRLRQTRSRPEPRPGPRLSVVVIVHKMPGQAERTLASLGPAYQRGVDPADYEVIVVENQSDQPLGEIGRAHV